MGAHPFISNFSATAALYSKTLVLLPPRWSIEMLVMTVVEGSALSRNLDIYFRRPIYVSAEW